MPLFHIHGLIAGLLAPLSAGGQVCCTPGFNALQVLRLARGSTTDLVHGGADDAPGDPGPRRRNNMAVIAANPLRFIRSSSAALPTQVIRELEEVFGAPVIESYGMTEAAHQMAEQPAAAARAQAGLGRPRRRARGRDHGRGRQAAAPRTRPARS